ncbi:MAG: hypothetical protein HQM04_18225 [Magnetococcales bacterium]|nr:hypothetical protein [Magnetococcales bacterium]MBF0116965.1 hypothetical protein [Magnetococcales bacterium]
MSVKGAFPVVSIMAGDYRQNREIGKSFVTAGGWGPSRSPVGVVGAKPPRSCFCRCSFLPEGHDVRELHVNLMFHMFERFSLRENVGGSQLDTALKANLIDLSKKIMLILPTFRNKTFPVALPFGNGLILGAVKGGNSREFGYRRTYTHRFANYDADIDDHVFRKRNHAQSGIKFITYIDYSSCAPEQDSIAEWERNFFLSHSDFIDAYWYDSLFTKGGFDFKNHLGKYESVVRDFVSHANNKDYYDVIQKYGARALGMVEVEE